MKHIRKFEDINNDWILTDMDLVGYYEEITHEEFLNFVRSTECIHIPDHEGKIERIKHLLKSNEGEKIVTEYNSAEVFQVHGRLIVSKHPNARFNFEAFKIDDDDTYIGSFSIAIDGGRREYKTLKFDDWGGILRFLKDKNII